MNDVSNKDLVADTQSIANDSWWRCIDFIMVIITAPDDPDAFELEGTYTARGSHRQHRRYFFWL